MSATTKNRAKPLTPVTVYVRDAADAQLMASQTPYAEALTSGPGTLKFHHLIAAHGAGDFETLFCPEEYETLWVPPTGGRIERKEPK